MAITTIESTSAYIGQAVRPVINIDSETYQSNASYQLLSGKMLRDGWLPSILQKRSFFNPAVPELLKKQYPYLWHRLVHILSFGYNTGKVLHQLVDEDEERMQYSCHIASLFNLVISIYDYLLDEHPLTVKADENTFNRLIVGLLAGDRQTALTTIGEINEKTEDPLLQLLLSSIHSWIAYTQFVYNDHKRRNEKLYLYILELFDAERKTAAYCNTDGNNDKAMLEVLHKKSAGPFIAIGKFICEITPEITADRRKVFESIVNDTGNVFRIVDDLSDIEKDLNSKVPNSILIKTGGILNLSLKNAINDAVEDLQAGYQQIKENVSLLCKDPEKRLQAEEYLNMNIAGWLNLFA
jgi:hypothetical protein